MLKQFATNLRKLKLKTLLKRFGIVFCLHGKVSYKMRCRRRGCRRLCVRKQFADVILIEFCCLMCTEFRVLSVYTTCIFFFFFCLWLKLLRGKFVAFFLTIFLRNIFVPSIE